MTSANVHLFPGFAMGYSVRQLSVENAYIAKGIDFDDLVREAHERTLKEAGQRDPNFKGRAYMATMMNWNMLGLLKERHGTELRRDEENRLYFPLTDEIRLYFKKFDNKSRPSNIPTKHVQRLNSTQGSLFNFPITIAYVGYRLRQDGIWDEIDCYMVEMKDMRNTAWRSDLSDLSGKISINKIKAIPTQQPTVQEDLNVRLKSQASQEGEAANNS